MIIGNKEYDLLNKIYIMGILNVTPDSFSDGGRWNNLDIALKHTEAMIEEGADIVDIGGESTRPGYTMISDDEEIERVVPVIEKIKANFDIPVSLDTYKGNVARAGLQAGADMINDIWGLKYSDDMADIIAAAGVPCCVMHNRKTPEYTDFVEDVLSDLKESLDIAAGAGIAADKIILDPGVGFAKNLEQNLAIMNNMDRMRKLGYPVLLGASRKSCIGGVLGLETGDRLEGTMATTAVAVMKGCGIVRVHDVRENRRIALMTEAILNG